MDRAKHLAQERHDTRLLASARRPVKEQVTHLVNIFLVRHASQLRSEFLDKGVEMGASKRRAHLAQQISAAPSDAAAIIRAQKQQQIRRPSCIPRDSRVCRAGSVGACRPTTCRMYELAPFTNRGAFNNTVRTSAFLSTTDYMRLIWHSINFGKIESRRGRWRRRNGCSLGLGRTAAAPRSGRKGAAGHGGALR